MKCAVVEQSTHDGWFKGSNLAPAGTSGQCYKIMMSVIMLNVFMLSVIMLSVVALLHNFLPPGPNVIILFTSVF
jgi:hypothetical protein